MKLVNSSRMPQVLFNALENNWYSGISEARDYSITELISPVRVSLLKKRHDDVLEVDAINHMWSMMGSAMHKVTEAGTIDYKRYLPEDRFKTILLDKVITGGIDVYDKETGIIYDYKFQTVWNYIYLEDHIEDLEIQLNGYRELLNRNGYKVNKMYTIYIFRDYQDYMRKSMQNYPDCIIAVIDIPFIKNADKMIEGRILEMEKYKDVTDDELPLCTPKERWQKPDSWKFKLGIRNIGSKYTEEEAKAYQLKYPGAKCEFKKEMPKRCHKYCSAHNFCAFYINEVLPNLTDDDLRIPQVIYVDGADYHKEVPSDEQTKEDVPTE